MDQQDIPTKREKKSRRFVFFAFIAFFFIFISVDIFFVYKALNTFPGVVSEKGKYEWQ